MENQIDKLIARGSIKISDDISFKTKAECASLFGRNYSHIIRGGVAHPKEEKSQLIFWQEGENDGWENKYFVDERNEITEFTERRKSRNSEWIIERTGIFNKRRENIIFYKLKGGGYKFRGIFHIDEEETISSGVIVYKRVSTEATTYLPENEKPIKDLKGLILSGRLKENEEIYLSYRGVEYSGRVTPSGRIKTSLGEFSVCKSLAMIVQSHPEHKKRDKFGNGYYHWKTWNDVPIGDLRKI